MRTGKNDVPLYVMGAVIFVMLFLMFLLVASL
jgi:hypothetical protein